MIVGSESKNRSKPGEVAEYLHETSMICVTPTGVLFYSYLFSHGQDHGLPCFAPSGAVNTILISSHGLHHGLPCFAPSGAVNTILKLLRRFFDRNWVEYGLKMRCENGYFLYRPYGTTTSRSSSEWIQ